MLLDLVALPSPEGRSWILIVAGAVAFVWLLALLLRRNHGERT